MSQGELAADGGRYVSADFKKKLEFQKNHIEFQKKGGKNLEFQKKSYEIPKFPIVREKIGIPKKIIWNSKNMEAAGQAGRRAKKVGRKP